MSTGVCYYLNSSVNPVLYSVMSTRFRAAFSLYVSDICSHSTSVTAQGSTRVSGGRITRKAPSSDQSKSEGRQSGIFGPVVPVVTTTAGGAGIASGAGILSNAIVLTSPAGNNHHVNHHSHPHPQVPSSPTTGIVTNNSRPEVTWSKTQNYYHVWDLRSIERDIEVWFNPSLTDERKDNIRRMTSKMTPEDNFNVHTTF